MEGKKGDSLLHECPVCMGMFSSDNFEIHVDQCLQKKFGSSDPRKSKSEILQSRLETICNDLICIIEDLKGAGSDVVDELKSGCLSFQRVVDKTQRDLGVLLGNKRKRDDEDGDCRPSDKGSSNGKGRRAKGGKKGKKSKNGKQEKKETLSVSEQSDSFSSSSSSSSHTTSQRQTSQDEQYAARLSQIEEQRAAKQKLCKVYQGEDQSNSCYLDCDHIFCRTCMTKHLLEVLKKEHCRPQDLQCPEPLCTAQIPATVQKELLSQEERERLEKSMLQSFLETEKGFSTCPSCHEGFAIENGSVQEGASDEVGEDGKALSREAIQHRAEHRFRCPKCGQVFCHGCRRQPYHLGFTCEQFSIYQKARKCRFCHKELTDTVVGANDVCSEEECRSRFASSCSKRLACGHACGGVSNEKNHLPCLLSDCRDTSYTQEASDFCNICWVESLDRAPAIQLKCKHIYHSNCVRDKLASKWPGARIHFGFLQCPLCKADIAHPSLTKIVNPLMKLKKTVSEKALQRLHTEQLQNDPRVVDPTGKYYKNPQGFALDLFAYYPCAKCKQAYFGGRRQCEEAAQEADQKFNPEDLVCGSCSSGSNVKSCPKHKKDFIEYKCKFCCNVASFFCWGNTHFCDKCHSRQEKGDYVSRKSRSELPKCPGPEKCVLGINHPPNGEEFVLGCGICRPRHSQPFESTG
eukprot:g31139.t1